ncbi:unnamed protein product [Microthlaspi erraticum]|uniref:Uncharacterized protein n=1 Tax=Microthlaspi erraticum TaxID=1685480 RepID=A0A6D2JMQ4_9BRAS|nr:unnamed protein product [Microthlaspi erraticum]
MGRKEHGGTWHMDAAKLDTQRKKGETILKTSSTIYSTNRSSSGRREKPSKLDHLLDQPTQTSSTIYSTNRSSSSTRPAKLQLDRAEKSTVKPEKCCFPLDFPLTLNLKPLVFKCSKPRKNLLAID